MRRPCGRPPAAQLAPLLFRAELGGLGLELGALCVCGLSCGLGLLCSGAFRDGGGLTLHAARNTLGRAVRRPRHDREVEEPDQKSADHAEQGELQEGFIASVLPCGRVLSANLPQMKPSASCGFTLRGLGELPGVDPFGA